MMSRRFLIHISYYSVGDLNLNGQNIKKTSKDHQPFTVGKPGQPTLLVWQIDEDDEKSSKYKRDKSLGILCQQFIGLFVTWRRVISLEQAARQISIKEEEALAGFSNSLSPVLNEAGIDLNSKMTEQDE